MKKDQWYKYFTILFVFLFFAFHVQGQNPKAITKFSFSKTQFNNDQSCILISKISNQKLFYLKRYTLIGDSIAQMRKVENVYIYQVLMRRNLSIDLINVQINKKLSRVAYTYYPNFN